MNPIEEWQDAFEKLVAATTNHADLAGHYPYSPERFIIDVNGTRQFPEYGAVPEYTEGVDGHTLSPQTAGDVVTMETAEYFRYHVQYVIEWSAALATNQTLLPGDALTFALGDADLENSTDDTPGPNADGWIWHWTSDLGTNEVTIAEYRDGTEVDAKTVELKKGITIWKRLAAATNWYNVGHSEFSETYTIQGVQRNPVIGRTSVDDGKGPQTANKPIQLSVKADSGAGTLEAELGSVGARTLGAADSIFRQKTHTATGTIGTGEEGAGVWSPIHALRIDPNRDIVNVQIQNTDIVGFTGTGDVQVMPVAVAPQNALTDIGAQPSDWSTPPELSEANSVIQTSGTVAQIPDNTGTTVTTTTNPGGHQLGFASTYTTGSGSNQTVRSGSATRKSEISSRNVCVFLANADSTGDIQLEVIVEEDW